MMETPGGEDVAVDPGPLPEVAALRAEMVEQVQEALLRLPFDQRTAVILCDLQGLSYDEIAEVTGAAVGTVKSRINRGRLRLPTLPRPALVPTEHPAAAFPQIPIPRISSQNLAAPASLSSRSPFLNRLRTIPFRWNPKMATVCGDGWRF